ncbi:hypothetical protein XNC3_1060009 [Xenorhabdus nematophila F1]|nr:hypothetical protein XNC3_1060009 [Xenorhabdus nematophila F1]
MKCECLLFYNKILMVVGKSQHFNEEYYETPMVLWGVVYVLMLHGKSARSTSGLPQSSSG